MKKLTIDVIVSRLIDNGHSAEAILPIIEDDTNRKVIALAREAGVHPDLIVKMAVSAANSRIPTGKVSNVRPHARTQTRPKYAKPIPNSVLAKMEPQEGESLADMAKRIGITPARIYNARHLENKS